MKNHFNSRKRDAQKYLQPLVNANDNFYIGVLFNDVLNSPNLQKYNIVPIFEDYAEFIPKAMGFVTKANRLGRYVRKQPEEKTEKRVHIEYTRRDGAHISYDRIYNVFVKELAHKFNVSLRFITNNLGQQLIVSETLTNDTANNIKNTHVINMFYEMFGDFEVFDENHNHAIHFNKTFEEKLLPSGSLSDERVYGELMYFFKRCNNGDDSKVKGYKGRIDTLLKYNPDFLGKGPDGFYGYLVFEFVKLGIVILESMQPDNATYVFSSDNYEGLIVKDKQVVLQDNLYLHRFYHLNNWKENICGYLDSLIAQVA